MTKKDFSNVKNNAEAFFSEATIEEKEEPKKPARRQNKKDAKAPKKQEKRDKRVQLVITPSLYKDLHQKAHEEDISNNEAIIRAIEQYLEK